MKIGDISFDGKMILDINDKYMTIVPVDCSDNIKKPLIEGSYSEFYLRGRKMYALLWMIDGIDSNTNFPSCLNAGEDVVNKINKEYMSNYYSIKV